MADNVNDNQFSEPSLSELIELIDNELETAAPGQKDIESDQEALAARENIGRHICIALAEKRMAIPLSDVLEVGELKNLQPLPLLPDWLEGITNIRGEIISVVNLGRFLGLRTTEIARGQPYLIVHNDKMKTAVITDKIVGTHMLYRWPDRQSQISSSIDQQLEYSVGQASYWKENLEIEIELFDIKKLLLSTRFTMTL